MTQYPEAYLARELGMHYAGIALVTDYDTGVEDDPGIEAVTMEHVLAVMEANIGKVQSLLHTCSRRCRSTPTACDCASAAGPLPSRTERVENARVASQRRAGPWPAGPGGQRPTSQGFHRHSRSAETGCRVTFREQRPTSVDSPFGHRVNRTTRSARACAGHRSAAVSIFPCVFPALRIDTTQSVQSGSRTVQGEMMMRRSPRSRLLFCAAVVVALVTALVVFQDIATLHDRASSLGPPRSVLVAARDLALGATLARATCVSRRVMRRQCPTDALRDVDDAVGSRRRGAARRRRDGAGTTAGGGRARRHRRAGPSRVTARCGSVPTTGSRYRPARSSTCWRRWDPTVGDAAPRPRSSRGPRGCSQPTPTDR